MPEEKVSTLGMCKWSWHKVPHEFGKDCLDWAETVSPEPPAADAGPRHACTCCGSEMEIAARTRDGVHILLCSRWPNCSHTRELPPAAQEARELTKAEWKEIAEGPCEAEDDDLSLDAKAVPQEAARDISEYQFFSNALAKATAPDSAMRVAREIFLAGVHRGKSVALMAHHYAPEEHNEDTSTVPDLPRFAALIRQAGSERERELRDEIEFLKQLEQSTSPCGHLARFAKTDDGGKHITCLECDLAEGPCNENVICDMCRAGEDSEAERLKAMEWGGE